MKDLEELAGRGDKEALHLRARVIEDQCAPLRVLGHAALLALKERRTVEHGKPVRVLREVGRYPVHNDADAGLVHGIDEVLEVVGVAVSRGRGVVARDLIAPGAVIGVLRNGHDLHMGIAHVGAVGREGVGDRAVAVAAGDLAPGAEMQLVNAHGIRHEVALCALTEEFLVAPGVVLLRPDKRRVLLAVLRIGGEGVALEEAGAVPGVDAEFIVCAVGQLVHKQHPDVALDALHGRIVPGPVVEVSNEGHAPGVRGPDEKAVHLQLWDIYAAEAEPGLAGLADVEKIDIVTGDIGQKTLFHIAALLLQIRTVCIITRLAVNSKDFFPSKI